MNQRSRTESAIASMPPRSISAIRASQELVGPDLGRSVGQHQGGEQLRPLAIELLGDQAADRKPDHSRAPDAERVHERCEVARIIGHVAAVGTELGEAVAPLVVADDAEVGREDARDVVPDAKIGPERIDEDERRAVPPPLVAAADDDAIGPKETHG